MPEPSANPVGIDYWNSQAGRNWVSLQTLISGILASVTAVSLAEAAPKQGEQVVDVGCGTGDTLLELAQAVGPSGAVLGIDVSEPMLDFAKHRASQAGSKNTSFVLADATTYGFEPRAVDLVFSRFGVMFFDHPTKAFANIRTGMKPGGRLVFACFRTMPECPWYRIPIQAALAHLPPQPAAAPDTPGMFSFADKARMQKILTDAGFGQFRAKAIDVPMHANLEQAMTFMTQVGPVTPMLARGSEAQREKAVTAVREALSTSIGKDRELGVALWLVSAVA